MAVAGVSSFLFRGSSTQATTQWMGCWFPVELLVEVAGAFFLLLRFSVPGTSPWLGCWFLVEELKVCILNIMEAFLFNILAARLLVMLTRTLSWEPTTVPSLFCFLSTEKTYWRDISHEKIMPYT